MAKVGIMTWYYGANYGALAQSIALYNTVRRLNNECYLINYKPQKYLRTIVLSNLPTKKEFYKMKQIVNGIRKIIGLSRTDLFKITKHYKNANDINGEQFDYIVFGSDAIFNCEHPLCDPVYYGVGIKGKKITYSPSCEYLNSLYRLPDSYKESLLEMKSISVRDRNTSDLLFNNIGVRPIITLDPTFLYDFRNIDIKICNKPYILIYSFSKWNQFADRIKLYANAKQLKIISIGQYVKWADINIMNASFEQWVSAFRYAESVVTDSFHGVVFSLKNKKQIVLCGREDKKAKISSLLGQFGITIEIYKGEEIEVYLSQNNICYEEKQRIIDAEIAQSLEYLKNALENE